MKRNQNRPRSLIAIAALLLCRPAGAVTGGTVDAIVQSNGLERNRYVYVRTPAILGVAKGRRAAPELRLAIDHYERAAQLSPDPLIRIESLRRAADLRVELFAAGEDARPDDLDRAIAGYQRALAEDPDGAASDRLLFQLARAQELHGDANAAIDALRTLVDRHPASPLLADAAFRAAELLYAAGRYDEAEAQYARVLAQGPKTAQFEPAQYKHGWAQYQQRKYREAAASFVAILERALPANAPDDPAAAVAALPEAQREIGADALRVAGLCYAALGGGTALDDAFTENGEPRFAPLLHRALAEEMLRRGRYSDAAGAYAAYVARHPASPLAPAMQARAVDAYRAGAIGAQVAREEARYADAYGPGAAFWHGDQPDETVRRTLRQYLDELGRWHHAQAQAQASSDHDDANREFLAAAGWYRRLLDAFPGDAAAADVNLRYADALYDGGRLREAADQYRFTADHYAGFAHADEAAYAAVQVRERLAREAAAADRPDALRRSVADAIHYADTFAGSAKAPAVLTRAAEESLALQDHAQAIALATRVLAMPDGELRPQALAVLGDAHFARGEYAEAEASDQALLALPGADDARRRPAAEQLAAAIYQQGEAARAAGDLARAARDFQRVGEAVPDAGIRPQADYDAAAAYVDAGDWRAAQAALERFRLRNPQHPLLADADKKLGLVYQKNGLPGAAAEVYRRIAQRAGESAATRRDAAWLAATLYDRAGLAREAAESYRGYIGGTGGGAGDPGTPESLDRGIEARRRLAALAPDPVARRQWLQAIVDADAAGGSARSAQSRLAAAQSLLELGRLDAATANGIALAAPLAASIARRKRATDAAIAELNAAAGFGDAEVTTAATYEVGALYRRLGAALLASPRPGGLAGEALEQYELLLAEQVDPFEQKAIAAHRANLARVDQGLWNDWVARSATELAELAPAQYGKRERQEDRYETLH